MRNFSTSPDFRDFLDSDSTKLFPDSECCVVIRISMRMQIIVGIWVLVSMMDFMPDKGEHETGIFATFTGKAVRCASVTFMSA